MSSDISTVAEGSSHLSCSGNTSLVFAGPQADLSGAATVEGTTRLSQRYPVMEYSEIPRAGWRVSRLGFGGDDLGIRPGERSKLFTYGVRRRGVNVIEIDIDMLHSRFDPSSHLYEHSLHDRDWERRALMRMLQKGWLSRDELVFVATANCGTANISGLQARGGVGGKMLPHGPGSIVERSARALEWLGLDRFDIVMAHVPAPEAEFGAAEVRDVVQELEQGVCRERVLSQGWGIACSAFSPLEAGSALDHAGRPLAAQPLSRILSEASAAAKAAGDEAGSHKMLAVRYLASATNPAAFTPAVVDDAGVEWSTSEILQQLRIAQLVKGPLDSVRDGRLFRAVDCDDHEPLDREELLKSVSEAINYAIHLEFMFDREVADAGRLELAELRKQWEREREEALVNELAALPEFSKDTDPGESTTARRQRVREVVAKMTESDKQQEAARLADAVRSARKAKRGGSKSLAGPLASAAAAAASGVPLPPHSSPGAAAGAGAGAAGAAGAGAPGPLSGVTGMMNTPYEGRPGEPKTSGTGFAASRLRPGVGPLEAPPPPEMPLAEDVAWGRVLGNNLHRLESLAEFQYLWSTRIDPAVFRTVRAMGATSECRDWAKGYQATMMTLRHVLHKLLEVKHSPRARMAAQMLDGALPEAAPAENWMGDGKWASDALHDRVLRILTGTPAEVILTEVPEVYGVKRPGNNGRVRGKTESILPPLEDRVPMARIKEALKGADVDLLLKTVLPDIIDAPNKQAVQETLSKGGEEAEALWSKLSGPARELFVFPSREERAEKMVEQEEQRRIEVQGGTVVQGEAATKHNERA